MQDEKKKAEDDAKLKRLEEAKMLREQKEEEKRKREEERERLKKEKEEELRRKEEEKRKREEERERLKKEKEEELKRREEEKRKREEERERLKKEKEEDLKRKEEEKERLRIQREEEKRKKDEEKEKQRIEKLERDRIKQEQLNAKLEEKKRKEEEKLKEEQEKRHKVEKVKQQFFSYFIKTETPQQSSQNSMNEEEKSSCRFLPFQLKANMYLPPIHRRLNYNEEKESIIKNVDELIEKQSHEKNYLMELKDGSHTPRTYPNTVELNNYNKDCIEVENVGNKFKVKLLLFDPKEYRRPPYFGTWRKKSKFIKPRKPFAQDTDVFDYDVDSDEEWEDEADGESINSSKCNDDEEPNDDDEEEDDGFFVPHGHLSDDEIDEENRILEPARKEEIERVKREQWEIERKKNSNCLVLKYGGCIWNESHEHLKKYKMVPLVQLPVQLTEKEKDKVTTEEETSTSKEKKLQKQVDGENPSPINLKKTKQKQPTTPSTGGSASPAAASQKQQNTTQSIMKFISRLPNKKDVAVVAVPLNAANAQQQQQPDTNISQPSTPQQSIPEKRVYSDSEQSCVKRLKLDTKDDKNEKNECNNKENEDIMCVILD